MRTIENLKKQERRLRERHTQQFQQCKWTEMQTTRRKLIETLNQIKASEKPTYKIMEMGAVLRVGALP